jgi:hypothetical protein
MSIDNDYRKICLTKETEIALNCIIKGFGSLQQIDEINIFYYAPFINLSNGFEKLVKCILCYSVLNNDGIISRIPFISSGQRGHDLIKLMDNLIIELNNHNYSSISTLTNSDMNFLINDNELKEIIKFLSDFSQGGRYYYLNIVLNGSSNTKDPEDIWKKFEKEIIKKDSRLQQLLVDGKLNELYKNINQKLVVKLESFLRALVRILAFGKFNIFMGQMNFQINYFLQLTDNKLGKTNYKNKTWDTLK